MNVFEWLKVSREAFDIQSTFVWIVTLAMLFGLSGGFLGWLSDKRTRPDSQRIPSAESEKPAISLLNRSDNNQIENNQFLGVKKPILEVNNSKGNSFKGNVVDDRTSIKRDLLMAVTVWPTNDTKSQLLVTTALTGALSAPTFTITCDRPWKPVHDSLIQTGSQLQWEARNVSKGAVSIKVIAPNPLQAGRLIRISVESTANRPIRVLKFQVNDEVANEIKQE